MTPQEAYNAFINKHPGKKLEAMGKYSSKGRKGYLIGIVADSPDAYSESTFFVDEKTKDVLFYSPSDDFEAFLDAFEDGAVDISTIKEKR